jgi:hypothetical protein
VSDIQRRGSYTPRRAREQRAYRLVVTGGVTGVAGVIGIVLAAVGAVGATIPVLLMIVAAICVAMFRGMTRPR